MINVANVVNVRNVVNGRAAQKPQILKRNYGPKEHNYLNNK
jgi:hypothetical protein